MSYVLSLKCVVVFHPVINQVYETLFCRFVFEVVVVDNMEIQAIFWPITMELGLWANLAGGV